MRIRTLVVLALMLLSLGRAQAMNVSFINPGRSDEAFWLTATQAMQAAARSLGIQLEVLYAEREPERALRLAREIAGRPAPQRPDYVLLVNEKGTLVSNAQTLGAAGIKTFAVFNGLLPQERKIWAPRQSLPLLLGSLVPDAREAGYLTAKALIQQALRAQPGGRLQMLAIAGDRSTPNSIARNEGMRQAVAEAPQVELAETVFADWRRDLAREQMLGLLQRHPEARLVWAGNDQMALGAMEALKQMGSRPGLEHHVSAINTSNEAMQALIEGRLDALAGGHFLAGAWALVMLYDHQQGRDFADEGLELERPMFTLFAKPTARRFLKQFGSGIRELDMRPYSKHLNPQVQSYRFTIGPLLKR
ncbi:MAG: ABC transporter substrate-binding protein [Roseateles asaccharophilus]|uniref:ABC transporter substrate-binding protein n=1 Tax=Roseateles asaccharophilus TaxID=582607 RepID=UPI003918C426